MCSLAQHQFTKVLTKTYAESVYFLIEFLPLNIVSDFVYNMYEIVQYLSTVLCHFELKFHGPG